MPGFRRDFCLLGFLGIHAILVFFFWSSGARPFRPPSKEAWVAKRKEQVGERSQEPRGLSSGYYAPPVAPIAQFAERIGSQMLTVLINRLISSH